MATPIWVGTTSGAWATGSNWSTTSAPADADTAIFDQTATRSVAGSDQSATELAAINIASTFANFSFGDNGSPVIVDATLVEIGKPSGEATAGQHSGRINLALPDIASMVIVYGTKSTSTDSGKEPVRIRTGANANKMVVQSGRVGVATDLPTDTAQFSEIACVGAGATVNVGAGTTLTKWRQEAGTGNLYGALTTLQQDGGVVNTRGSGAITTVNVSGTTTLGSTGTITTLNVLTKGTVDLLQDSRAKTITTINLYAGSTLKFDPNVVTVTNPIVLVQCELEDVTIVTPRGLTIAIVKT